MSDEVEVIVIPGMEVETVTEEDKALDAMSSGGKFLPRVQLMTSNSKQCKDGSFPINNYALISGAKATDLGKDVDIFVIERRATAMDISGDDIIVTHDLSSDLFQSISAKADADSNSKNMYGPEYLVWIPEHGFATLFMASKTARNTAPDLQALRGNAATLKSRLIETKAFSWQAITVTACSTFDPSELVDPANADANKKVYDNFKNPPVPDVVEEAVEGGREV